MNSFSDDDFRDLPPRERRYEIQVADNLFFAVFPNGVKTWVLVYRFEGIVRRQTLGTFPEMPLAQALREADKDPGSAEQKQPPPAGHRPGPRAGVAVGIAIGVALIFAAAYRGMASDSPQRAPDLAQTETPAPADPPGVSPPAPRSKPPAPSWAPGQQPDSDPVPVSTSATTARADIERPTPSPARDAEAPASAPVASESERSLDSPRPAPAGSHQPVSGSAGDPNALPDTHSAGIIPAVYPGETVSLRASGAPPSPGNGDAKDLSFQGPPEARRALLALDVVDREPIGPVSDVLSASPDIQRVYFYTDVRNAVGSDIVHRWILNGTLMAERRFAVRGNYRWRVYSAKDLEPGQLGSWRVELRDGDNRLLAEQSFIYAVDTLRLSGMDGAAESPGSSSR